MGAAPEHVIRHLDDHSGGTTLIGRLRGLRLTRGAIATASTTAVLAFPMSAQAGHWCTYGDPPIYASAHTSCPFAGRMVDEYVNNYYGWRSGVMYVRSPVTHKRYRVRFRVRGGYVRVRGRHGIRARFSSDFG